MQRGGRIVLAAGVLLTGAIVAMLFRLPSSTGPGPVYERTDPVLLRKDVGAQAAGTFANRPAARIESQATALANGPAQPPTILMPMDPGQPPPELARSYPRLGSANGGSEESAPATAGQAPRNTAVPLRRHTIADGDTLPALAEHYLGSAERYPEILEANRDVLSSPGLLPIGAVLKIPSPAPKPAQNPVRNQQRPLVPVPAQISQATDANS